MINIFKKSCKKLVTHNSSFHSDDIFAAATISLYLESLGEKFEIIRSRDQKVIDTGDYVFDVGGVYDPTMNRFDHHQVGGAGRREDEPKIEYASFGLVWKKFGEKLCGSDKVALAVDRKLVAPVDAGDNGFNLVENKYDVAPYLVQNFFSSMGPTWQESSVNRDKFFLECVEIAKKILSREITQARDGVLAEDLVVSIYNKTKDKRIIVLDKNYPFEYALHEFTEPLFVVYPRESSEDGGGTEKIWGVKAVRENLGSFKNRKDFPAAWAGLRDGELQNITGVTDAVFCHRGLFMAVAKSKEGAIKLAELALIG